MIVLVFNSVVASGRSLRSEENNVMTGAERTLLLDTLDTGDATTIRVTISSLPDGRGISVQPWK